MIKLRLLPCSVLLSGVGLLSAGPADGGSFFDGFGFVDLLHLLVRTEAARFGGSAVERMDDRVTAVFDGPARAIRCGRAIDAAAAGIGLGLKIGVHAGECDPVAGVANSMAAEISGRIARLAQSGEVLVSRTVVDLVAGSGLHFSDRGSYRLADGLDEWHVFALAHDELVDLAQELAAVRRLFYLVYLAVRAARV